MSDPAKARPHLLVISQVFPPDPAAVGQYLGELASGFVARGTTVTVVTSARGYDNPALRYPRKEYADGGLLRIRRFGLASFGKKSLALRLLGQLLFVVQATLFGLFRCPPGTRVLISTSPPFSGIAALMLRKLRGFSFADWVMDINPDQSVEAGVIEKDHLFVRALDWLNCKVLASAGSVLTLDDDMADRLREKGCEAAKLEVLPLWVGHGLGADEGTNNAMRQVAGLAEELGTTGKFVVLYSGNHSLVHPMATFLEAALRLKDEDRIVFIFAGGGAARPSVEEFVSKHGLVEAGLVVLLPYQPVEKLQSMFLLADVHAVTMGDKMVGCVHPSKTYSALACGRPPIWTGPKSAALAKMIVSEAVGWCFEHGEAEAMSVLLRGLVEGGKNGEDIKARGLRAVRLAEMRFSREKLLDLTYEFLRKDAGDD